MVKNKNKKEIIWWLDWLGDDRKFNKVLIIIFIVFVIILFSVIAYRDMGFQEDDEICIESKRIETLIFNPTFKTYFNNEDRYFYECLDWRDMSTFEKETKRCEGLLDD